MTFEDFFREFWWLLFPLFGMVLAVWGMIQTDRRTKHMLDLIKSYADQGKEPPPELLRLAAHALDDGAASSTPGSRQNSAAWSFIVFAAIAAGFGVGWYMVRAESWAFAFALVAVIMGVMALGALLLLLFGRK